MRCRCMIYRPACPPTSFRLARSPPRPALLHLGELAPSSYSSFPKKFRHAWLLESFRTQGFVAFLAAKLRAAARRDDACCPGEEKNGVQSILRDSERCEGQRPAGLGRRNLAEIGCTTTQKVLRASSPPNFGAFPGIRKVLFKYCFNTDKVLFCGARFARPTKRVFLSIKTVFK